MNDHPLSAPPEAFGNNSVDRRRPSWAKPETDDRFLFLPRVQLARARAEPLLPSGNPYASEPTSPVYRSPSSRAFQGKGQMSWTASEPALPTTHAAVTSSSMPSFLMPQERNRKAVRARPIHYNVARQRTQRVLESALKYNDPIMRANRLAQTFEVMSSIGPPLLKDGIMKEAWGHMQDAEADILRCNEMQTNPQPEVPRKRESSKVSLVRPITPVDNGLGPLGLDNIERVTSVFPFCGRISGTQNRAITSSQLDQVYEYLEIHCDLWRDEKPRDILQMPGLELNGANLYDVNRWVIMPATRRERCSLVECMTSNEQPPSWFVSHWWGEFVSDFMTCIRVYVQARSLPHDTAAFWICAYANRQHALASDICPNPKQTSFFKAMESARFKVVVILDQQTRWSGPATPFERIWCAFELTCCLDQEAAPLDVVTCHNGIVELITNGLLDPETALEEEEIGKGYEIKTEREASFPLEIVQAGLAFDIRKAQASVLEDRQRILNCIAGRNICSEPLKDHESYDKTNRRLHSLFALVFFRRAFASDQPKAKEGAAKLLKLQQSLVDAIRKDEWRTSLDLNLSGCLRMAEPEMVAMLMGALPSNLRKLELNFGNTDLGDDGVQQMAQVLPPNLQELSLNFENCENVGDRGAVSLLKQLPCTLTKIRLDALGTQISDAVKEILDSGSIEKMRGWEGPTIFQVSGAPNESYNGDYTYDYLVDSLKQHRSCNDGSVFYRKKENCVETMHCARMAIDGGAHWVWCLSKDFAPPNIDSSGRIATYFNFEAGETCFNTVCPPTTNWLKHPKASESIAEMKVEFAVSRASGHWRSLRGHVRKDKRLKTAPNLRRQSSNLLGDRTQFGRSLTDGKKRDGWSRRNLRISTATSFDLENAPTSPMSTTSSLGRTFSDLEHAPISPMSATSSWGRSQPSSPTPNGRMRTSQSQLFDISEPEPASPT